MPEGPGWLAPATIPFTPRITRANCVTVANNGAGGTVGQAVTTGNSGGISGTPFDGVNGAGQFVYDNTYLIHGPTSWRVSTGATATTMYAAWNGQPGPPPGGLLQFPESPPAWQTMWFRVYFLITGYSAATQRLLGFLDQNAVLCGSLALTAAGNLRWNSAAGANILTGTTVVPLGQWVRIEGYITGSSASGQVELKTFIGANVEGTVPDETFTSTATQATNAPISIFRLGQSAASQANYGPIWFSSLAVSSCGYIGPVGAGVNPAAATQRVYSPPEPPGFISPMAWQRVSFPRVAGAPPAGAVAGPPIYPLGHPAAAKPLVPPKGSASGRAGVFGQLGPPAHVWNQPIRAPIPAPIRGGQISRRSGIYGGVGPAAHVWHSPARAPIPAPVRGGRIGKRAGVYGQLGPPARQWTAPIGAVIRPLPPRGRAAGRAGIFGQLGPPARQWNSPAVQARQPLPPGGRISRRAGTFTLVIPGQGPPVYPLGHPVQAKRLPTRGGSMAGRAGVFSLPPPIGPPIYPLGHPVAAKRFPTRGGTIASRSGPLGQTGPPVRVWHGPIQARQPLPPRGRIVRLAGTYGQAGPPVRQWHQPAGIGFQQPPPPTRGRAAGQRGPYAQTGPPVRPLHWVMRGQPQKPMLTGRMGRSYGTYTAPPPPPTIVPAEATATVTDPREGKHTVTDPNAGLRTVTDPNAGLRTVTDPNAGKATVTDPRDGRHTVV